MTSKRVIGLARAVAAAVLCVATVSLAAHAAQTATEVFYKDQNISEAVLSPSGKRLALTARGEGKEFAGLVVIDLAPGGKADRIGQYVDGDVVNVHWVNDDRLVFSIVDMSEGSGQINGAPGLFAINADGSKFRRLVQRQGTAFFNDGRDADVLEWNHFLLEVPIPKEGAANEEVLLSQFSKDEHGFETPLWLNTRTGRTRSIATGAPSDVVGWIADNRGELRVAFTHRENKQAAYAVARGAGAPMRSSWPRAATSSSSRSSAAAPAMAMPTTRPASSSSARPCRTMLPMRCAGRRSRALPATRPASPAPAMADTAR